MCETKKRRKREKKRDKQNLEKMKNANPNIQILIKELNLQLIKP